MLLALGSGLLALGSLLFALSPRESTAAPVYKVTLPGISGDDSSGATFSTPGANPTASPTTGATPVPGSCNYDRVSVKTLSDPAANFGRTPQQASVNLLHLLNRPATIPAGRIAASETTIFTLNVELSSMAINASRELVLLVTEPANTKSMLLYLPHKDCMAGASDFDRGTMIKARNDVIAICGDPSQFGAKFLRGQATITGAAFWGPTGVPGAAPNGIELHPVLEFKYNSAASCDPNASNPSPSPTPTPSIGLQKVNLHIEDSQLKPGEPATAWVQTTPPLAGLDCEFRYYEPTIDIPIYPTNIGIPHMTTDADGRATWNWNIPNPTPLGRGQIEARCGNDVRGSTFFWVDAP